MRLAVLLSVVAAASLLAQGPPVLSDLQQKDVEIALLNAQLVAVQEQLDAATQEAAKYRAAYNRLQLAADRQARTPPAREGFTWQWDIDPKTGRPMGYIKSTPTKKAEATHP